MEVEKMMNRHLDIEKDFNENCKVYDIGVKDYFGNKFYIVHNELLNNIRFYSKNKDYNKRRKELDKRNLQYVIIQKYGEVIDITEQTYNKIQEYFQNIKLPCKELLNIW